ncbi:MULTISPECIES: hypothetical protein [Bacillus]|uniref:Uncharacterized protein n=1 Tax=Bacillus pseudomycoides TaxID=64104 RepID=A0A1Y3M782_9BACI|nr:hypothetical protein [Bacillus pseudomycoides]MDF2082112.1 hypothetical protein [Bacillus pseudomycoides]OUM46287.1 hypothetical protein BW425_24590 [Bacillus pseudomycoides]
MPQNIDNMTAKTKRFEINEHGVITIKQGGTYFHGWVDKHHIESKKIIDDKIKSVEASFAKGTGNAVSDYLDDIVEAGSVNATKMIKLKMLFKIILLV